MRILLPVLLLAGAQWLNAQSNLQQIGHLSYAPLTLAGCWHHVDSMGGEWALVGTSAGLSVVDLRIPTQPVERFTVPGLANNWREVKTWGGFAYVGSEAPNSRITIVDLRALPDTIYWKIWQGTGIDSLVRQSHTVQAEDGYLYIFGGNLTNGAVIATLADPWNPHVIGKYSLNYVHDGFIRGDTLWTSEIYSGQFGVVDISDRTDPQLIITNPTPGAFNHNTGLSDDGKYLFTTDEKIGAPLGAFDVSDLDNITLLDRYFPSQKPTMMVHNVRVLGNYLINPSYGGQLTIVDATHPDNLIETAWAVVGNSLVWDADPYLPSGIIFATAKQEGFFVFQPTYQHAAWLQGLVTDAATGQPLNGAKVFVVNTPNADTTLANGSYKTGADNSGSYAVKVERPGYQAQTLPDVALTSGQVKELNIALSAEVVAVSEAGAGEAVKVWPTVFSQTVTVTQPPNSPYTRAQLLDAQGKVVSEIRLTGTITQIEPNPHLPKATYWLRLLTPDGTMRNFRLTKA